MRLGVFMQSYTSDHNFGCAHFLRGLVRELLDLGHDVQIFCPATSSVTAKAQEISGDLLLAQTQSPYPNIIAVLFDSHFLDLEHCLTRLDAVLVNEWIDDGIARRIGEFGTTNGGLVTLYYDTHHRVVTATEELRTAGVDCYSRILVLAESVERAYVKRSLATRITVFPEAVDEKHFKRSTTRSGSGAVVWIGNYGNDERGESLVLALTGSAGHDLRVECYGAGFPPYVVDRLLLASVRFRGWIPNTHVPDIAASALWILHVPRAPYVQELAGVPNIRPFEAAGLGVPLVVISAAPLGAPFVPDMHYRLFPTVDQYLSSVGELVNNRHGLEMMAERAHQLVMSGHTCRERARALVGIILNHR